MTVLREPRIRRSAGYRAMLACWLAWTLIVLLRYFIQLWRVVVHHPSELLSTAWQAGRDVAGCALVALAFFATAAAAAYSWRTMHRRLGWRASPALMLAGAAIAYPWFASREAFARRLASASTAALPALGEALARAVSAAVGTSLVFAAAYALGRMAVDLLRLDASSKLERAIVAVTLGFGALSFVSLGLAGAGIYRPPAVALLIVVSLMAGAIRAARRPSDGPVRKVDDAAGTGWPRGADLAWMGVAVLACSFALVAALAPEIEFDALWYHLDLPRRWLEAGRPVDLIQEYPSLYPLTWELVFGAGMVMGGIVAAKLLHALCLVILAGILTLICRRYARALSPYVAVGLLVTMPTVLWEAGTAYIDLALAMYACLACYALVRFAESGHRSWLLVSAIEFGLAAATKHLGLVVLAIAVITFGIARWRRGEAPIWLAGALAILVAIAVLFPLPWYLRAWHASGNPFFPELYGLFGGGPPTRWNAAAERGLTAFKDHFGAGHSRLALLRLPWDMTVHSALFGGSLGPLPLILLPACAIGTGPRRLAATLAAGTAAYLVVWASPVSSYQMRFLVPVAAALALLAADGYQRVVAAANQVDRRAQALVQAALVAIALLSLPPFITLHEADRIGWNGWLTHVLRKPPVKVVIGEESEADYLARTVQSYPAWQYANAHLPADAVVLTFSAGDQLYSRRTRIPDDSVLAAPAVWAAQDTNELSTAMQQLGVTHILFSFRKLPEFRRNGLPIASDAMQRACTTEYEDRSYRLCRVNYSRLGNADTR